MSSWWPGPWQEYEKWGKSITTTLNMPDRQMTSVDSPATPQIWGSITWYINIEIRLFEGDWATGEIVSEKTDDLWENYYPVCIVIMSSPVGCWTFSIFHWKDVDSCFHTSLFIFYYFNHNSHVSLFSFNS